NSFSRRRRPTRKFVHRGLKGRRVGAGKGAGAEPGRPAPDRKQKRLPEMRSRKAFAVEPAIGVEPMTSSLPRKTGVFPLLSPRFCQGRNERLSRNLGAVLKREGRFETRFPHLRCYRDAETQG